MLRFGIISALILPLIMASPIFEIFRVGKFVGGLADFLHGLNICAHGFHLLISGAVLGSETFRFGLPMFRCNLLSAVLQIVQISDGGVIQGKSRYCERPEIFPEPSASGQRAAD